LQTEIKQKTFKMKTLINILACIKAFFIHLMSNRKVVKDKNRADYIASESEMINHLISVVEKQAIKTAELTREVKLKLQQGEDINSDIKDVEKEVELLRFYQKELYDKCVSFPINLQYNPNII